MAGTTKMTWSAVLCRCGRHAWAVHSNPEVGGKAAVFETCRRCGTERMRHEPASARRSAWFGA